MVESGPPLGLWQATDHRGGDLSTQGLLRTGAPSRGDAGRPFNAFGGQDRSIHLGPTDQQLPWPTVAPPGGPVSLVHCTSLVLGYCASGGSAFSSHLLRIYLPLTRVNKVVR